MKSRYVKLNKNIQIRKNISGDVFYITIRYNGKPLHKTFKTLEEAEMEIKEIKDTAKVKGFDYPLDFIDALFGSDKTVDIQYIEEHFDNIIHGLLETLTEREQRIMKKRFIEGYTLEAVGRQEGVTRERIRQIEAKALRKLKHPSRLKYLKYGSDVQLLQDDVNSLIRELNAKKIELMHQIANPYLIKIDEAETIEFKRIDDLDLSIRSYNCLKRGGINTIGELLKKSPRELFIIRNLGRNSMREIITKLDEIGIDTKRYKDYFELKKLYIRFNKEEN